MTGKQCHIVKFTKENRLNDYAGCLKVIFLLLSINTRYTVLFLQELMLALSFSTTQISNQPTQA